MTLAQRLGVFTCETCTITIPLAERQHHLDHHKGTCRCTMAIHRIRPEWLRRGSSKPIEI